MHLNTFAPGIDGLVPVGVIESDGCCPPDVCAITTESLSCSFISLLPSGPLWDQAKVSGLACKSWCDPCGPSATGDCASLVNYAAYTGRLLYDTIAGVLWPALREASPFTAWTTMDSWLDRLGWRDCYNSTCRDAALGPITPYEIMGECGPTFCPPIMSEDLQRLYKRGVIVALWRMRHGIARNLAAINFILEPLFAELAQDPANNQNDPAAQQCLVLRPTTNFANKIIQEPCPRTDTTILEQQKQVQLYLSPGQGVCVGAPSRVYPLQLAAHCIVRSLLPSCNTVCVKRKP